MVVALIFFGVQSSKVVKADTADVIGTLFGESKEQSYFKSELRKWGLEKKDLVALKSKEIQSLFSGNILIGDYDSWYYPNINEPYELLKGRAVETYYEDGRFKGVVLGPKQKVLMTERAIWSVKQNKLCYKDRGCVKVYKHKRNPNVYFLKSHGFFEGRGTPLGSILVKFSKITSIAEVEKQKREQIEKAEKERIAKEKEEEEERRREADNKFRKKSAWGSEKLYDCKSLAKEAKKVKLSNMLGAQFKVITLTNVTETINNRSELICVGDARLSNGSESKLIMKIFHENGGTVIEVRQDQQDMLNKFLKELGQ